MIAFHNLDMTTNETIKWSDPKKWNNSAEKYNDAVGRSTTIAATQLIALAHALYPLDDPEAYAIDFGAGTGSLTHQLAAQFPSLSTLATDISSSMLDQLMTMVNAQTNITTQVADMASPIGGAVLEGAFSHVFSTMAIQVLPEPAEEGTLAQWAKLLVPNGVVAIGMWDFDENCGPLAIWNEAALAVDPEYVSPPLMPPGHWTGCAQLEQGLRAAGFRDVYAQVMDIGFDVGKDGFMRFFWESGNPMPKERQASFHGDLSRVKANMEKLLDERYSKGSKIPLSAALAVGRKP